jgi:hypothetical protein
MRVAAPRSGAIAVVVAILALAAAACGGGTLPSGANGASGSSRQVLAAATPTTTIAQHDGSLGDADTKQACTLLTAPEIEAQFGGPVGEATPIYPYCQWLVGTDAFIAVTIYRQPISEARNFHPVRFDTSGLGDDGGYIATTRAVFFGKGDVTYSILWQKVGDFTTVETEKLTALAQAVLGRV